MDVAKTAEYLGIPVSSVSPNSKSKDLAPKAPCYQEEKSMDKANLAKRFFVGLFLVAWIAGCAATTEKESTGEYIKV